MLAHASEQDNLENEISKTLRDLTDTNTVRMKAGLRILMTTDYITFQSLCSETVQEALEPFKKLLDAPETLAPETCKQPEGREAVVNEIKDYTIKHLDILDTRPSILPNTYTVTKSIQEKERLKAVIHTSALKNVVTNAQFTDTLEKYFRDRGFSGSSLDQAIKTTVDAMLRLHQAVLEGNALAVDRILHVPGVDVNFPNPDGLPLLHIAVRDNQLDIVKLLLKFPGINVNAVSNNGWAPLHIAARLGYDGIVRELLSASGIQVNIVNSDGWTPLHWAAWHGNTEVVTSLTRAMGIHLNYKDSTQMTALHWAARNGHAEVITILVDIPSVQINAIDNEGKAPLHYAVQFNHMTAASVLLELPSIEINHEDMDGLTPLHWAARQGSLEITELLISYPDIQIDAKDHNEMTPYDWAKKNGNDELLPLLRSKSQGSVVTPSSRISTQSKPETTKIKVEEKILESSGIERWLNNVWISLKRLVSK